MVTFGHYILYAFAAACLVLPNRWVVALLPAAIALQKTVWMPGSVLFAAGPFDLLVTDVAIVLAAARLVFAACMEGRIALRHPLYAALGLWLAVNLAASLVAAANFGEAHAIACVTSWARGLSEVILVPILAHAVGGFRQVRMVMIVLLATVGALLAIQFINFAGASHGFVIGEVQGLDNGEVRYFGPVGDSIGFVLLFGFLFCLCVRNLFGIAAFLGGILLTAGLGTFFATAVAVGFWFLMRKQMDVRVLAMPTAVRWIAPLLFFAAVVIAAKYVGPLTKTTRERLSDGRYTQSSSQRFETAQVAISMASDHPVAGVGFMGFRLAAKHYGGDRFFGKDGEDGAKANANNQLLQALTDSGLFGVAALILLLFAAARSFHRLATRLEDPLMRAFFWSALLWLIAQTFGNLAATWLTPSSMVGMLFWIFLGLGMGVERLLGHAEPESEEGLQLAPVR